MIVETLKGQMEKLEELLPGIENYLSETLANENLSDEAEELRQYFVERLDILKLPPSRPPRTSVSHHKNEAVSEKLPLLNDLDGVDAETKVQVITNPVIDFAAKQRELSRTLLTHTDEESNDEEGKVYDDIGDDDGGSEVEGEKDDQDLYEVPVTSASADNLGPTSTLFDFPPGSSDDLNSTDTTLDSSSRPSLPMIDIVTTPPPPVGPPPPLPPRHHRQSSDERSTGSLRLSMTFNEPPELPARPHLPPRSEIYALSERSDKSEKSERSEGPTDDGTDPSVLKAVPNDTGTSYESYEEETGANSQDSDLLTKLNLKLPVPIPRKKKKRKAFSKSQSSSQWDLHLSFKDLNEVTICGELNLHGKLTWNRRIVAVTNRRLLCYKPEKMGKPALVVQLPGYQATYNERENRKGFEILLHHPLAENYVFSVDLIEWAQSWCEYIQAAADGRDAPGRVLRLYRHSGSFLTDGMYRKGEACSASSTSIASSDAGSEAGSYGPGSKRDSKDRTNRVSSLAQRASTFLIKKRGPKKQTVIGIPAEILSEARPRPSSKDGSLEGRYKGLPTRTPKAGPTEAPSSHHRDFRVSHEGYLYVYTTYKRQRIGKRWCLVRENQFECYPNEESKVCEMSFPLKDCTFRQAKQETNSEKSIMILQGQAEKITVEPLLFEVMDDWISVLLRETMTVKVPEGLDRYYTEKEYEVPPEDLLNQDEDPDDPYSCIKDVSASRSDEEMAADPETAKDTNEKPKEAKIVADMYSPVLWETKKRNSSKTSISGDKEDSPSSATQMSVAEVRDQSNHSQDSTPDIQPLKSLYTAAVTDSGYTTASSPTSTNQESPNDNGQAGNRVTSPSNPNTMESLMKAWDVKAKIQTLENNKPDSSIPKIAASLKFPMQKKSQADVKSKTQLFEGKNSVESTPTPTPPKRKRSLSVKTKVNSPKTSPSPQKPVSLNFSSSNSKVPVSGSVKEVKEIDNDRCVKPVSECSRLPPHNKELPSRETNQKMTDIMSAESHSNGHANLPIREDSVSSSCDTDSYVTDSSDSALRSEHETPMNSDSDSVSSQPSPTPKYNNSIKDLKTGETDLSSLDNKLRAMGEDLADSREGSQERHTSRESSQEPTTSCSSWDSSQETNFYNFDNGSSPDTTQEDADEIFFPKSEKNPHISCPKEVSSLSVSSENSQTSDVTLLSNKAISTDSVSGHLEEDVQQKANKGPQEDVSDWMNQLDMLRRQLVELKKNRIKIRDRRLRARDEKELFICEEEFQQLDDACKETSEEISALEGRIKLTEGQELTHTSEA